MSPGSDSISCVLNPLGLLIFLPSKNKKLIVWLLPILTMNCPKSRFKSHHNMGSVNTKRRESLKDQKILDERHWMMVRSQIRQRERESEAKKRNQMVKDMKDEKRHEKEEDMIRRRECLSHLHHQKSRSPTPVQSKREEKELKASRSESNRRKIE